MAALDTNPQLLLAFFVRMVRGTFSVVADQKEFLFELGKQALMGGETAVANVLENIQDYHTSSLASGERTTQWLREMSALTVATLCEAALTIIEADALAGGVGTAPQDNASHADFSQHISRLG